MKTTLNLPDALLEAIKERAKSQGRTQTSVIEEALRKFLAAPVVPDERPPMPTFGVAGNDSLRIDLLDREALYEVLDESSQA